MTTRDNQVFAGGAGPVESERCAWVRDRIPLKGLGLLSASETSEVDAHILECPRCASQFRLVRRLQARAPEPPASILEGVRAARAGSSRPDGPGWGRWAVRSAAVALLAVGIGMIWSRSQAPDPAWAIALELDPPSSYSAEWIVAGQPVPDALPDDVLRELLEEIEQ